MRYVGKYVGQLVITLDIPADECGVSFDELEERFHSVERPLQDLIAEELFTGSEGTVRITMQMCDVWKEDDHAGLHRDSRV